MTLILRILSLASAFLMIVFLVMPFLIFTHGTSPIRDAIASIIFLLVAILAMRCTRWLWQSRRFWTDVRSLSEMSAFGCLLLLWPIAAILEKNTSGVDKDLIQIAVVLLPIVAYVLVRRHARMMSPTA